MTPASRNGRARDSNLQHGGDIDAHPVITIDTSGVTSPEIERIIERFARQSTVTAAQKAKTVAAMARVHEMYRFGSITIDEVFHLFAALDDSVQFSTQTQQLYDEHRRIMLQAEISAIYAILALGERNIKNEVARALDVYPVGLGRGGSGGFFAGASLNAKIGIGSRPEVDIIDIDVNSGSSEPKQRFDGFVVGETGFGDEFGGLRNGRD